MLFLPDGVVVILEGAFFTVTVIREEAPSLVKAVMVALPTPEAVIFPVELTFATEVLLLLNVTDASVEALIRL